MEVYAAFKNNSMLTAAASHKKKNNYTMYSGQSLF